MNKNILILSGSPRKGANTDKLARSFKEGAESTGKEAIIFRAADMKLKGCQGCNHCLEKNSGCVQQDDMLLLWDFLYKADTLVLASPVYFFGISAQLKLVIDRTYGLKKDATNIKQAALLLTCADGTGNAAEGAIVMYKQMLAYRQWADIGIIVVPGLHNLDSIDEREELEQAWALGRKI